jgi:hypothetical protein
VADVLTVSKSRFLSLARVSERLRQGRWMRHASVSLLKEVKWVGDARFVRSLTGGDESALVTEWALPLDDGTHHVQLLVRRETLLALEQGREEAG